MVVVLMFLPLGACQHAQGEVWALNDLRFGKSIYSAQSVGWE
jgi:hypothetical protein